MIPEFDDNGYLSPGIHPATLDEIAERFGRESELRQVEMESVRWLFDLASRAGIERIILNGSFVTDAVEPNDVDCVLLTGGDYPLDRAVAEELATGLPFIDMHLVEEAEFEYLTRVVYGTDRYERPRA